MNEAERLRDRLRSLSRRKHTTRARTVATRSISKRELALAREAEAAISATDPADTPRPRTRAECTDGPRPCPWVSCKWHLYMDVTRAGNLKFNFPDVEPHELVESCALDVADRGGSHLEKVGEHMNLTRERVRQIETEALAKIEGGIEGVFPDEKQRRRLPIAS